MTDEVAVGDLNSDAPGSGARKNAGKPQLDLIPIRIWRNFWANRLAEHPQLADILDCLVRWQEGDNVAINGCFAYCHDSDMLDTVKVFEFGAKKYKAWNWAKGMPWSVPTGCILRHAERILLGEETDPESGYPHLAHVICNVVMLSWYASYYREGDDRPPIVETRYRSVAEIALQLDSELT